MLWKSAHSYLMALGIRLSSRPFTSYITSFRNFTMTSPNSEKALEDLKTNPYFEKYADRIAAIQKTSPEEFMQRVAQHMKSKEEEQKNKFTLVDTRQYSSVLNPKGELKDSSPTQDKKLQDIFKTELVVDKEPSEIRNIWEEYHKNKEVISATIPLDVYVCLRDNMTQLPTFLFPLPRSQGYEFIMSQTHAHTVHFTPLLAYQVHKENAPECLTMVHYTELSDKGIILMRGEYDKNVLTGQEAQCLANQFQMYYSGKDPIKMELLQKFTRKPESFKHMDLISQLENISVI